MNQLASCIECDGFVPESALRCPHCAAQMPAIDRPTLARRLLQTAGGGAIAITLMACYGLAPQYRQQLDAQNGNAACDQDRDGFCAPDDCDDSSNAIHPGAADVQGDEIDQNCDGIDGTFSEEPPAQAPESPPASTE